VQDERIYECAICAQVLLVLDLCRLIVGTYSRWSVRMEAFSGYVVGLYLVSKCTVLQFCNRMFIYCAANELLTEALVIRDGRTAVLRDGFVGSNQSKTNVICHIGCDGPFLYGFVPHYNVHRVQFVHLIFRYSRRTASTRRTGCSQITVQHSLRKYMFCL